MIYEPPRFATALARLRFAYPRRLTLSPFRKLSQKIVCILVAFGYIGGMSTVKIIAFNGTLTITQGKSAITIHAQNQAQAEKLQRDISDLISAASPATVIEW